ncbi:MAG: SRPBCC domain-containing protein [Mycobacteriales bacterium]
MTTPESQPEHAVGFTKDVGWEIGVSRTLLYPRIRLTWCPSGWEHDTTLQVTVSASGSGTLLRFHQERLASPAEREAQRIHWQSVVDALAAALGV